MGGKYRKSVEIMGVGATRRIREIDEKRMREVGGNGGGGGIKEKMVKK